jgi:protocatechuate 3,4-dioxygenase beta subunit
MNRPLRLAILLASGALVAAPAAAAPGAPGCTPTPNDAFGPFGRGEPPLRAKIGTGHVLTGVVLSSLDCSPIRGARVNLWQVNRHGDYIVATSGTVVTDRAGRFRFEAPYPPSDNGQPPHIHLRVFARLHRPLLTRFEPRRGERIGHVRLVLQVENV